MVERLEKIKEILIEEKQIEVSYLSDKLNVSEVTIRRDLDKLEKEGFLKKTYGGAILVENQILDNTLVQLLTEETNELKEERESIAQIVLSLINNGEAIFLGNGPTSLKIARAIKKNNFVLTVLTNDLLVAIELFHTSGIKVVLTGGDLMPSSPVLVGSLAENSTELFYIQKAFIEVSGVDFKFGYSLNSLEEVEFVHKLINYCKESYIVADHTCYNKVAFSPLGKLLLANKVISSIKIPEEYKEFFFNNDVTLYNSCDFS